MLREPGSPSIPPLTTHWAEKQENEIYYRLERRFQVIVSLGERAPSYIMKRLLCGAKQWQTSILINSHFFLFPLEDEWSRAVGFESSCGARRRRLGAESRCAATLLYSNGLGERKRQQQQQQHIRNLDRLKSLSATTRLRRALHKLNKRIPKQTFFHLLGAHNTALMRIGSFRQ